jgi:hypothetical protein
MRAFAAAVIDDLFAVAAGVHQGGGQDRQALEDALLMDGAREVENRCG